MCRAMTNINQSERVIWEGSPSQWLNCPWFGLCAAVPCLSYLLDFTAFIAPLLLASFSLALWRWQATRCVRYRLTSDRFRVSTGVLNRHIDSIELYRVKDAGLLQPLWMRLCGMGSVYLISSDVSMPHCRVEAIADAAEFYDLILRTVDDVRLRKGVREMDFARSAWVS